MATSLDFLHLDMDAFFAAVEERDNPYLKGHPVIVGGRSNRGIVTTCNYEARKYGIHSAMPIFMAKERCPHGIYVPGRMSRYQEVSRQVFQILRGITDRIEPLSIDEAYMDISGMDKSPEEITELIKSRVMKETELTLSIGVSFNKFLAKLASDWNKPDGFMKITEDMMPQILFPLQVSKVYGIGSKSRKRLNDIGIYTVEQLYQLPEDFLVDMFGRGGREIYDRIRGVDRRTITTTRERKSMGVERTFRETRDKKLLIERLKEYSIELEKDLESRNIHGRTLTVKIKDEDFQSHTRSRTFNHYISDGDEIFKLASMLFGEMEWDKSLRLLGVSISNLMDKSMEQLSFLGAEKIQES
ncbi:DNA polymerase IV [Gudongella sp. DL1XJH-153]|uniref:DNA polymerase IV n=1 Tax=Gudongella sp. DL1XJH-153 TaxID=3409804 RepID=UPI003BB628B8